MPTVEPFADVDVQDFADWLHTVPMTGWPKLADPAHLGWGERFKPLAVSLMAAFPGCSMSGMGLFLLEPGQEHPAHRDEQAPGWITRVHVPIVTNPLATVTTDEGEMHMQAGRAYTFDTLKTHAVRNGGTTPRVHLVFDVRKPQ